MKPNKIFKKAMMLAVAFFAFGGAISAKDTNTHSPIYTAPCSVKADAASQVICGNVLCYYNQREFPVKNTDITTDPAAAIEKYSKNENLGIGAIKANDFYTFVLKVEKAGNYAISFTAAHQNSADYTMTLYQASGSDIEDTDANVKYTKVGTNNIPNTGSWNPGDDYNLSFTTRLSAGVNYIKILFGGGNSYAGNIGKMKVEPRDIFTWTTSEGPAKNTIKDNDGNVLQDNLQALNDGSKYQYCRTATSNPLFKILGATHEVYSDGRFKFNANQEYAIVVPANVKVNKLTFVKCSENYYKKNNGVVDETANIDSEWDYIKSEGATVEISNGGKIETEQDITATLTDHQPGTPILYCAKKCAQVAFSSLVIDYTVSEKDETYTLSVGDAGAATLVLPFEASIPDGVKAYKLTGVNGNKIQTEELTGKLPANTPVLVNADKGDYEFASTTMASQDIVPQAGLLTGSWLGETVAQDNYVLQMQNGQVAFYPVKSDDIVLKPRQAYLTLPVTVLKANKLTIDFSGVTAIKNIESGRTAEDTIYNAAGQRVEKMTAPGLYIKNGKKYIVK